MALVGTVIVLGVRATRSIGRQGQAMPAAARMLGGMLIGVALPHVGPGDVAIALLLLLVIRPLVGLVSMVPFAMPRRERAIIALFGVRGIGALYHLAFAASQAEFADMYAVWAIVLITIFGSTLIHGLTAAGVMAGLDRDRNP